ncbi:hypothetical protein HRW19_01440 [Streptomyces lunaelactis]|nr:hypothetical protein [Streptomyces lunaelactis]
MYDIAAAERELGYRPVTTYEDSLAATVEWLVEQLHGKEWTDAFPKMAAQYAPFGDLFGYADEDAWLEQHGRGAK